MAHNNLAVILEDRLLATVGKHGDPDSATRAEMLEHFEAADRLEDRFAPYNLGNLYRDGTVVKKDLQRAYAYFETAAERGEVEARYQVGLMLEEGNGVPVNYAEAAYHFRLAALDNHQEALRHLVNLYLTGRGVSQDFDRAAFWLERLARLGQIGVLVKLGDIALAKGDYADARKLFTNLADWNNERVAGYACERLSRCYEFGWGGKPNPKRAQSYFDRAVKLGNGDALFRLAMQTMAAGRKPEALVLFEQAAHSSAAAAFSLGQMYFFGTNVTQDRNRAYGYLRRAADSGHRDALYFLAAATFNRIPDAPAIDEAIRFAEEAESLGQPQAGDLRQKLERRRRSDAAPHQESTGAHPG